MDPEVCLRELRALIADEPEGSEIAEHFEALDAWISRGGFVPHDWQHRQQPDMIVVESSVQLDVIRKALKLPGVHKLRVWIDGDCVKFKVNEYTWSPPMGRIQERY